MRDSGRGLAGRAWPLAAATLLLASRVGAQAPALPQLPAIDLAALSQELELGPLKLTFGPQDGGEIGAVLAGNATRPVAALNYIPPHEQQKQPFTARYGAVELNVDAGWSSAPDALNQTTLAVKPSVTFVWLDGAKPPRPLQPQEKEVCDELGRKAAEAFNALLAAQEAGADPVVISQRQAEFDGFAKESDRLDCSRRRGEPPASQWAVSFYPDVMYRFGEYEIDGERFEANQLIVGVAGRVFVPGTADSPWFREWPRLSFGYYTVSETEESTVPVPEQIEEDTIRVSGRIAMRLPFLGTAGNSPLHLDLEATATKAMSGEDTDWQVMRQLQLAYATGDRIIPAITYRSGSEQGIVYDKQVILGLLWLFATGAK